MTRVHKKLYEDLTEAIIGVAIEVHKTLGPGFKESLYENAMAYELEKNEISFVRQRRVDIPYKDIIAGQQRLDLVIEDKIIVELKAVSNLEDVHLAQILSYLKTTRKKEQSCNTETRRRNRSTEESRNHGMSQLRKMALFFPPCFRGIPCFRDA
jgi:GxxExxY protein